MGYAITYKDLYLSFGEVISMDKIEIIQEPNKHGTLLLSAVLDGEQDGEVFDTLPETVSVLYRIGEEEKILFKGMVAESSMERVGNHRQLELKAYDATYLLDTKRKTRSFQNTSRTNHSVIDEVMKEYPDCICTKNLPEEEIGRIWFQYEETDWEFLRRFLSHYSDSLYADATYYTARFQAGLSPEDIEVDWDSAPYRISKALEWYDYLSQNGFEEIKPEDFMEYSVDSFDLYTLGSRLTYKGRKWYIGGLKRVLSDGLLVSTYELKQREGLLKPHEYNQRITGISMDGKTVNVQNDKVQVTINGDMTTEQGTYWFPFSTVAASADGSGWYSMPEIGDSIRVYFPTCDEKEGYVITKHDSHMPSTDQAAGDNGGSSSGEYSQKSSGSAGGERGNGNSVGSGAYGSNNTGGGEGFGGGGSGGAYGGGAALAGMQKAAQKESDLNKEKEDPMDDPSKRNIFTQDGCIVQLVPDGVILSAGESTLVLKKDGEVIFDAPQGVSIYTGDKLTMSGRKITFEAGTYINLTDDAGSDIHIRKPEIKLHGKNIYEN